MKGTHEPALAVQSLTVSFGDTVAFRDLTFEVARGSTTAIIGPNGAGKTVLLRTLLGSVPYAGTITWAPETTIGYVPQRIDLDPYLTLTLGDFLRVVARVRGADAVAAAEAAREVRLEPARHATLLVRLSGGELQRALIAAALIGEPTVLLFDEPTSGVDPSGEERIYETVHAIQDARQLTVILVSHDLSLVARYADTVFCLNRSLACLGTPAETLRPEVLDRLYGGALHHAHPADHDAR